MPHSNGGTAGGPAPRTASRPPAPPACATFWATKPHRIAVGLLHADETRPGVRETVQGLLDMARGLGLANVLTDDTARRGRVVAQWAAMVDEALG
ncbi:hypothetical protein [Streptomyces sp. BE230]|uniref:hypothetical protein n=1 Tax=Streptomyces sp. BE230 TaxID=3002526 RepID=UPI003FA6C328